MGRSILYIVILLLFTSATVEAREETIVLQPDSAAGEDTWISNVLPFTSCGDQDTLLVGKYNEFEVGEIEDPPIHISGSQNSWHGLLKFILPSLPADAVVLSADLSLYVQSLVPLTVPYTDSMGISVHPVESEWIEGLSTPFSGATWFHRYPPYAWASAGGDYGSTESWTTVPGDGVRMAWPIPALVEEWIDNPPDNYGVLLKKKNGDNAIVSFATSDHTDESLRPKLTITYETLEGDTLPAVESAVAEMQPTRVSPGTSAEITAHVQFNFGGDGYDTGVDLVQVSIPGDFDSATPIGVTFQNSPVAWTDESESGLLAVGLDTLIESDGFLALTFSVDTPGSVDSTGEYFAVYVDDRSTAPPVQTIPDGDGNGTPGDGDTCRVAVLPGTVVGIAIDPVDPVVTADSVLTFTAIGIDAGGFEFPVEPVWALTGDVGTIAPDGTFDPTTTGTGLVIATVDAVSGTTTVEVNHGDLAYLIVLPVDTTISIVDDVQYTATGYDADNNPFAVSAAWQVTPPIGIIFPTGRFQPDVPGSAIIIGSAEGYSDTAAVTVMQNLPSSISITPTSADVTADTLLQFSARVYDSYGSEIDTLVEWHVHGGIGSIDLNGLFDAIVVGTGAVIASLGPLSDSAAVTVSHGLLDSLALLPADTTLTADESVVFTAEGFDADRNSFTPETVWSEPTGLGAIDSGGLFEPHTAGNATVIGASSGIADTADVAITPGALVSLEVIPSSATVHTEETIDFAAVGRDGEGNGIADPGELAWDGAGRIGTIDPATGHFEPTTAGVDTVYVTAGVVSGMSGAIVVVPGPARSVAIWPGDLTIFTGDDTVFSCTALDGEGNAVSEDRYWTSTGSIGSMDETGRFHASSPGDGSVIVTVDGESDTAAVTVWDNLGLSITTVVEYRDRVTCGEDSVPLLLILSNNTGDVLTELTGDIGFTIGGLSVDSDYTVTEIPFTGTIPDGGADTLRFTVDVGEDAVTGSDVTIDGTASGLLQSNGDPVTAIQAIDKGEWSVTGPPILEDVPSSLFPDRVVTGNSSGFSIALRNNGDTSLLLEEGTLFSFSNGETSCRTTLTSELDLPADGSIGLAIFETSTVPSGLDPGEYPVTLQTDGTDGNGAPFLIHFTAGSNSMQVLPPYILATTDAVAGSVVYPGTDSIPLIRLEITNLYYDERTLSSLTLTNENDNPESTGDQDDFDAEWDAVHLLEDRDRNGEWDAADSLLGSGSFSGGIVLFNSLSLEIAAGDTLSLLACGDLSMESARDGEELALSVADADDIVFIEGSLIEGSFPLLSPGVHFVDGFIATQLQAGGASMPGLPAESNDSLVLSIRLPSNGYAPDTLRSMTVRNLGTAEPVNDLAELRLWLDDGNGAFGANDSDLGTLYWNGDGWTRSGIQLPVPVGGVKMFLTVDVTEDPVDERTVLLAVPVDGIVMASSNDGPIDTMAVSPSARIVGGAERVLVSALAGPSSDPVVPGQSDRQVLRFSLSNVYSDTILFEGLTLDNRCGGTYPDSVAIRARLYCETEAGKDIVPAGDPIATADFSDGSAVMSGFSIEIRPGGTAVFSVTADIGLRCVSDGDTLRLAVENAIAIVFHEGRSVAGAFPVLSASPSVNGFSAAQAATNGTPGGAITPSEKGRLALEVVVPPNGCDSDTLIGVRIANEGNADHTDLDRLVLFGDGGAEEIGELVWNGTVWAREGIQVPVGAAGETLAVRIDVSDTAQEGHTVTLSIPIDGIDMKSDNDGPVDEKIVSPAVLYISTSPIFASFDLPFDRASAGQEVDINLVVENMTGQNPEAFIEVTPGPLSILGPAITILDDPADDIVDSLPPGGQAVFTWRLRPDEAGTYYFLGDAWARNAVSGDTVCALPAISVPMIVETNPSHLAIEPVATLPAGVARGDGGIPLMILTLSHGDEAGSGAASIEVDTLHISFIDSDNATVAPSALLSRVTIDRGGLTIGVGDSVSFGPDEVVVPIAEPVLITGGEAATLTIRIDLLSTTEITHFRGRLSTSSAISASDANSGDPVELQGVFPFHTQEATVVIAPAGVTAEVTGEMPPQMNRGARSVPILEFDVENRGISGVTADVTISSIRFHVTEHPCPFEEITITGPGITHFEGDDWTETDGTYAFPLTPPLVIPAENSIGIWFSAHVDSLAPLGVFRFTIDDSTFIDPRISDVEDALEIELLHTDPFETRIVTRTNSILASGEEASDSTLAYPGENAKELFHILFHHPGGDTLSPVNIFGLHLYLENDSGDSVEIRSVIDQAGILYQGNSIASVAPLTEGRATLVMPFGSPVPLEPGDSARITIRTDLKADAPAGDYRFCVEALHVTIEDGNEGEPVGLTFQEDDSEQYVSRLLKIRRLSDRMLVWVDLDLPAVTVAGALLNDAARVRAVIAGDEEEAPLHISGMVLIVEDTESGTIAPADAFASASLDPGDGSVEIAGSVETDRIRFDFDPSLLLAPTDTLTLSVDLEIAAEPLLSAFRIALPLDEITLEENGPVAMEAEDDEGNNPSGYTHLAQMRFEESVRSYPNPFTPDREEAHIAFYSRMKGQVKIRIYTGMGIPVRTLESDLSAPGLAEIVWDGRNGKGNQVLSGVYLASIEIHYEDGEWDHAIYKIAVLN